MRRRTPPRILPVSKVCLCPRLTLFCPASPARSNLPSSPPSLPLGALLHSSRPLPPCSSHLPVRSSPLLQHREANKNSRTESQLETRCDSRVYDVASLPSGSTRCLVPLSLLASHPALAPHFPTAAPRFPLSLTVSCLVPRFPASDWYSLPPGLAPRFMPSSLLCYLILVSP